MCFKDHLRGGTYARQVKRSRFTSENQANVHFPKRYFGFTISAEVTKSNNTGISPNKEWL